MEKERKMIKQLEKESYPWKDKFEEVQDQVKVRENWNEKSNFPEARGKELKVKIG